MAESEEKFLVKKLRRRLSHLFKEIHVHVPIANKPDFRNTIVEQFGYAPVLNEIDMIFIEASGALRAVEVKYFKLKDKYSFNRPFYDGIGQALTLLRYGFDNVGLWHLFSDEIEEERFDRYGANTWSFIRNDLRFPLEYTYFTVSDQQYDPNFTIRQYISRSGGITLCPIDDPDFQMNWRYPNPFRETVQGRFWRREIIKALGTS